MGSSGSLVDQLMVMPLFDTKWVLYLLGALSVLSLWVMLERFLFLIRHRIDVSVMVGQLDSLLLQGKYADVVKLLSAQDSFETNVVLFGLKGAAGGADGVEDMLSGAMQREKLRYERGLPILATTASIAPFIGLFGTVLGIIHAFHQLSVDMTHASSSVMSGISEALVTTALGLFVAIPTLAAYNILKTLVKNRTVAAHLMSRVLQARLKSAGPSLDALSGFEVPHGL